MITESRHQLFSELMSYIKKARLVRFLDSAGGVPPALWCVETLDGDTLEVRPALTVFYVQNKDKKYAEAWTPEKAIENYIETLTA